MGIFSRDQQDEAAPAANATAPHAALASPEAFRDAPLEEAAAAVLVLGFGDARPWAQIQRDDITMRAHELFGPAAGLKGSKLLMYLQERLFGLVESEALDVLQRSLLIHISDMGGGQSANLTLTRRGRRALDSGEPERWMDVPAAPA